MGKGKKNRREKVLKPDPTSSFQLPAIIYKCPDDKTKPLQQPKLIPLKTFETIADHMLERVPPHRNVFLSMSEYRIRDVNPTHKETNESPTHMIVFCLRLVVTDEFHPIGVVQIDKRIDQTNKLVYVWKTYLQDLSLLRLIVIGSISPPSMTFHKILKELTQIPNMKDYIGPITYSVWPYNEIVHLYDYYYLLHETQEALYERGEMCFMACSPAARKSSPLQLWTASWTDILLVLTSQGINCYYISEDRNAQPLAIFFPDFWKTYRQAGLDGIMDTDSKESTDRLMELLCPFSTLLHVHKPFMCPYDLQNFYDNNEELRMLLATAKYKKLNVPNSGTSSPDISKVPTDEILNDYTTSTVKCNLKDSNASLSDNSSAKTGSSIEIGRNQMTNIFNIINSSLNNNEISLKGDLSKERSFDNFLQKITYDNYDLFVKTSSKFSFAGYKEEEAETSIEEKKYHISHDHDYFRKQSPERLPSKKENNSTIYNIVKNYFGDAIALHKKSLDENSSKTISPLLENFVEGNSEKISVPEENGSEYSDSNHYSSLTIDTSKVFEFLMGENKDTQPSNVMTICDKTDKFSHKLPKISRTGKKPSVREKAETTKKGKILKIKESKGHQLLRTSTDGQNKRVRPKRPRNNENAQKLIASLPYILSNKRLEKAEGFLASNCHSSKEIFKSKTVRYWNASNIISACLKYNVRADVATVKRPKNKKTDNFKTLDNVCKSKYGAWENNNFPEIQVQINNLSTTVEPGDVVNIDMAKNAESLLSDDDNSKIQEYSDDNHNNVGSMLQVLVKNGQEPVENVLNMTSYNKNTLETNSHEKPYSDDPHREINKSSLNFHNEEDRKSLLENVTESILNSAVRDFSNILASYKKALKASTATRDRSEHSERSNHSENDDYSEHEVLCSINGLDTESKKTNQKERDTDLPICDSDSIDSLTELLNSIEADPDLDKIPCKYTIPNLIDIPVKHRLKKPNQDLFTPSINHRSMDQPTHITQDLFYQMMQNKSSLEISPTSLEEEVVSQTLNMLAKTLKDCSRDFESKMIYKENSPLSLENKFTKSQSIQTDRNASPPLSNPDSLEEFESNKGEVLTTFVTDTALHENISKMFTLTNTCLRHPNKPGNDVTDSFRNIEDDFLGGTNLGCFGEYSENPLDKEMNKNFEEENNKAFIKVNRLKNKKSSENNNTMAINSVEVDPTASNLDLSLTEDNQNNKTFTIENTAEEQGNNYSITGVMSCCKIASTSDHNHSPSSEINNQTCLPYYTRFETSFDNSTSSPSGPSSVYPKESMPNEENLTISAVAENLDVTVDAFNEESRKGVLALDEPNSIQDAINFLNYTFSIKDDNDDSNGNYNIECKDPGPRSFSDEDASFQDESLVNSKVEEKRNDINVLTKESIKLHDKILDQPDSVVSKGFIAYYKSFAKTASIAKPTDNNFEVEYQPEQPNDYNEYKEHKISLHDDAVNKNKYEQEKSNDFIEYKEYKRSLESCDNHESKCDIIYKDRKTYEKLYSQIPDDFETVRLTTDWLCAFKGYIKLKEILVARKVRQFQASILSLEHIDFFVHLIKKGRNNAYSDYKGKSYRPLDYRCMFDLLSLNKGVYMITKDNDVYANNISL